MEQTIEKIRAYSDIHLDHYFLGEILPQNEYAKIGWYPPPMPDDKETILVLAGDLWIGTQFIDYRGFSWIGEVAKRFKEIVVVLGNHDYWRLDNSDKSLNILGGAKKAQNLLHEKNINNVHILDCEVFDSGKILFVGATLWTDLNKYDPLTVFKLPKIMQQDSRICHELFANSQFKLTADKWYETHQKHKDYIDTIASQNFDRKIVVVTHHAPVTFLHSPKYLNSPLNGYYASDLSNLIRNNPNIVGWIFGHQHDCADEMLGKCRIINRAIGYQGQHREQAELIPHDVLKF